MCIYVLVVFSLQKYRSICVIMLIVKFFFCVRIFIFMYVFTTL